MRDREREGEGESWFNTIRNVTPKEEFTEYGKLRKVRTEWNGWEEGTSV